MPRTWSATAGEVYGWIGLVLLGIVPFTIALVVLIIVRPGVLLWWTACVYVLLAGAFAVSVDVEMVTSDDALMAVGLFIVPLIQLAVLVPLAIVITIVLGVRARRGRFRTPS